MESMSMPRLNQPPRRTTAQAQASPSATSISVLQKEYSRLLRMLTATMRLPSASLRLRVENDSGSAVMNQRSLNAESVTAMCGSSAAPITMTCSAIAA